MVPLVGHGDSKDTEGTSRVSGLRLAARQARALAETLLTPEGRLGFLQLAQRWEAEAAILEQARSDIVGEPGRSVAQSDSAGSHSDEPATPLRQASPGKQNG